MALAEALGRGLEAREPIDRRALAWVVEFLRTFADRCHHGKEEQHLFPALERHGVPVEGGPIGVMLHEHDEGRALLRAMGQGDDREVAAAIRGYATLLRAHIRKENDVLFPLAEHVLDAGEQRRLLEAFDAIEQSLIGPGEHQRLVDDLLRHEARTTAGASGATIVDVRAVPPRERHPMIFQTFDGLLPGQAFVLVNDHDPKPLYYQFQAERAGRFGWEYLEEGPEVWRVRIGRTS